MDTIRFIKQCLNEVHVRLLTSMENLSQEQLVWRPAPHANCIAEVVWHLARSEDCMARPAIGLGPELWESRHWYKRFNYPKELPLKNDYQILKGLDLPEPKLEDLVAYIEDLHKDTLDKLSGLMPADLDRAPNPSRPEMTIG